MMDSYGTGDDMFCPYCKTRELNFDNIHILRTWIHGEKTIACDGDKHVEDTNAQWLFNNIDLGRSSSIIIMYSNEFCQHVWLEITVFHKGQTFRYTSKVESGDLLNYINRDETGLGKEMWRT